MITFPEGTIFVDEEILPDGTRRAARIEYPNGTVKVRTTLSSDGILRSQHVEYLDGDILLDVVEFSDRKSVRIGAAYFKDGFIWFNVSYSTDGFISAETVEHKDCRRFANANRLYGDMWTYDSLEES